MRLIDADALKTRFEPKQAYFTESIMRKIDTEIAIQETQWIPCSERLPEYDETSEYLVTDKEGRVRHCCLDPYMPETFVTVEEGAIIKAVAWMPLPEKYKRGDTND